MISADAEPVFRVAVTGHRPNRLPQAACPRLRTQLGAVMAAFEAEHPGRSFTLLSGLAEGADRLAAEAALSRGWRLVAMLPFSRARYLEDFPDAAAQAQFAALLARATARHEAPDADTYAETPRAYAELGSRLIADADALIAIWDGEPAQGRGGTVEVIAAARAKPIPVIWIHAAKDVAPERLAPA
ncbi:MULTISPECIES: DUF2493 domain-containing protein [Rhodomicrobium]|uniref:DUF2493 domain-containing protein n=1 Tax=Rhodomicrobium TaxID=1068 RepID=UPI000B4B4146|nr:MULTISPECIES: DUF2493 domain-containing protein [Rhodomicrobium]